MAAVTANRLTPFLGKMNGFTEEEILQEIRNGSASFDKKLDAKELVKFTFSIVENRGRATEDIEKKNFLQPVTPRLI